MAATSASLGMMTAKITRSGISLQSRSFNGLTFIPEHWVCMRSNLCQCFEHSHDHLVVISELLFTHKYFKLLMNTNQNLMDGWMGTCSKAMVPSLSNTVEPPNNGHSLLFVERLEVILYRVYIQRY